MIQKIKKFFLKIKRYFFYKSYGFYPEDVRKLVYVQKYLDKHEREQKKKYKSYNDYIKQEFKK